MASAARPSGFSKFSNANGSEKSQRNLGHTLTGDEWNSDGIWGNPTLSSFRNPSAATEPQDPSAALPRFQGGPSQDVYSNPPQAYSTTRGTFPEQDRWNAQSGHWNMKGSPRATPGNTSPSQTRENPVHDVTPYHTGSQAQIHSAIGQKGSALGRTTYPGSTLDTSTGSFGQFAEYGERQDTSGLLKATATFDSSSALRNGKRSSQDSSSLQIGAASRDPGSNRPDADQHGQANLRHGFTYTAQPSSAVNSRRPSVATLSGSFPCQASSRVHHPSQDQELQRLTRNMSISDVANGQQTIMGNGMHYPSASHEAFHLNPGSQPWDNTKGYGNGGPHQPADAYSGPSAVPYADRLGVTADRISPAAGHYRVNAGNAGSFGAPQPASESWPRPSSRDLGLSNATTDQRNHGQPFLQQHTVQFYPDPLYPSSYQNPYPPASHYEAITANKSGMAIPTYGLPISTFMSAAGLPRLNRDPDPTKAIRSVWLEEFKSRNKSQNYPFQDIHGHIVEACGDQTGSRYIQRKLEEGTSEEKDQIFREIEPNAVQLAQDYFGNYVIQKFLDHGSLAQKKHIIGRMKGKFAALSVQMYACRVVQKALDHALVEQQVDLVNELEPNLLETVKNQHGNHVIQKAIQVVPREYTDFIMNFLRGRAKDLSNNQYGCRVVQRALEHGNAADKAMLVEEIQACIHELVSNQYGNYVVQHVIQHGGPDDRARIFAFVTGQVTELSRHKYASNVVEKSIKTGSLEQHRQVRDKIIASLSGAPSPLQLLARDQYGNYVMQTLLTSLKDADQASFASALKPELEQISKEENPATKQIRNLEQLVSDILSSAASGSSASQADANSVAQTPNLTTEANSPSSSSPSTDASAIGEAISEPGKADLDLSGDMIASAKVRIGEA